MAPNNNKKKPESGFDFHERVRYYERHDPTEQFLALTTAYAMIKPDIDVISPKIAARSIDSEFSHWDTYISDYLAIDDKRALREFNIRAGECWDEPDSADVREAVLAMLDEEELIDKASRDFLIEFTRIMVVYVNENG